MTLIASISGIRGTIGGQAGSNLTPPDIVKFTAAYAEWLKKSRNKKRPLVVIGRDARLSGPMLFQLVSGTLTGMGAEVVNLGLASTPTTEIMVTHLKADGGLILTASHNPLQWNALKMLNHHGEFLNDKEGRAILDIAAQTNMNFAAVEELGSIKEFSQADDVHIKAILKCPLVNLPAIRKANFKVVVDGVNSVGGVVVPKLLKALGVKQIVQLNCTPDGRFPHPPEPLPENLTALASEVKKKKAHVGFAVDPDVDRLAIINEDGTMFGEEYTLVAVADYVLKKKRGNTVSNLSSTRALKDITLLYGGKYAASAVGEVNVVEMMKATKAVIGGEGNGGVILPSIHYGRDALVGIALFLSLLATSKMKCSQLRASYPSYSISKNKIHLAPDMDVENILQQIREKYKHYPVTTVDGLRIDFEEQKEWVHLRKSNTEPILRVYAESPTMKAAEKLAEKIINDIRELSHQQTSLPEA